MPIGRPNKWGDHFPTLYLSQKKYSIFHFLKPIEFQMGAKLLVVLQMDGELKPRTFLCYGTYS